MPAMLYLAVLAASVSKAYKIEARPGWTEQLVLYVLVLLATGNRKSGVMREMTAPLYHFEKGLIEEQRAACEVGKHELDVLKAQLEDLKKSYVKAKNKVSASDSKSTTRTAAEIRSEMEELARQISETPEPSLPTLITGDVTEN